MPVRDWLRDPVYAARVQAMFDSPAAARFFQVRQLHRLLDRHLQRQQDNWRQIFCIYCFLVWYEQFFGSDAA